MSIGGRIDKGNVVFAVRSIIYYIYIHTYIYNRMLFSLRTEGNLPFATIWMNLYGIMLSEINQKKKDRYCMVSLLCGI